MARFTAANAREFAARSVAARKAAEAERKARLAPLPAPAGPTAETQPDLFSLNLARACDETLELLRHAKKPSEKAQLSRALRDLREVWHLATGKPLPFAPILAFLKSLFRSGEQPDLYCVSSSQTNCHQYPAATNIDALVEELFREGNVNAEFYGFLLRQEHASKYFGFRNPNPLRASSDRREKEV